MTDPRLGYSRKHLDKLLRDRQAPPTEPWREWFIVGGCGYGKTYAHIEWIKANPPQLAVVFTMRADHGWFIGELAGKCRFCIARLTDYGQLRDILGGLHPQHSIVLIDGADSMDPAVLADGLKYIRARGFRLLINSTEAI